MIHRRANARTSGVTIIELMCVMGLITILAGILLGPVSRVMRKARAMEWGDQAPRLLNSTVQRLRTQFQGKKDFPVVTLAALEEGGLLDPSHQRFLRDRRVTFYPFAGSDPDAAVVVLVRIESGFLTEAGQLAATKGEIARPAE